MKPSYPQHTVSQVTEAFAQSRRVQPAWAALSLSQRSKIVKKIQTQVVKRADELAAIISRDNGKVLVDAMAAEVVPAALAVSYYRATARRLWKSKRVKGGSLLLANKQSRLHAVPYGVVGVISPWNYPFSIPFSEVVMALLAGNGVVLKVASDCLGVGVALKEVFLASGLPEGLFAYVNLPGAQAGPAFIEAGVDKLFFTGSTEVGRQLAILAAPRLLPLVLELGGNDAAIIRADADVEQATAGILWSGFSNSGQSCGGAQRILVHRSIYQAFLDALARRVRALRPGDPSSFDTDLGTMTSARQKKTVEEQVAACVAAGARVYAQSPTGAKETFLPAQILVDVTLDMPVMKDEVFGPVVAVCPYDDEEEAVRIANSSCYGLTASVWSRHHREAKQLATRLRAGAVTINDHLVSHGLAETPWGGFGDSGLGRTHGEAGLSEMVQLQVIVDDWLPGLRKAIWWHPYSQRVYDGLKGLIRLLYGPGLGNRLAAIPQALRLFLRYWER